MAAGLVIKFMHQHLVCIWYLLWINDRGTVHWHDYVVARGLWV